MALIQEDKSNAFEFDASELIRSGVFLSHLDTNIPFWKSVDGVLFSERGMSRRPGREEKTDVAGSNIRGILGVNEFSTKTAYIGDLTEIHSYRLDTGAEDTVGTGYSLITDGGGTTWDAGGTTWDAGTTVWDEGVNEASSWSMVNFGSWVFATNDVDKPQVKKNNINFNDLHDDEVSGAVVTAGGTGYVVGEVITMTGGSGSGFEVIVTEESGNVVTAFEISNFGSGYLTGETLTTSSSDLAGNDDFTCTVTVPDAYFDQVKVFAKQGPYVLAYNYETATASENNKFAWCEADDPDEWVASATNTAGSLRIREANTGFKAVAQLGDSHAVYTENQMFLVSYVGLPNIFGYRPALEGDIGAVSVHSVVSVGRMNYGLSPTGFFATDGVNVNKIGKAQGIDKHVKDNGAELAQVAAYHNADNSEIVWLIPISSTQPNKEFAYNYEDGTWTVRTTTLTHITERDVFDNPLSGNIVGEMFFEGNQASDNGASIAVSATTKAFDLGNASRIKELTSIRVGKQGNGTPQIRVGWSEDINGTPTYVDTFNVTETFQEHHLRTAGRWLFLEVTSSGSSDTWEISTMVFQGRFEGSR